MAVFVSRNESSDRLLASLVLPAVGATEEAGKLLENLPDLWEKATIGERKRILQTMLEAVYVDAIEAKAMVLIRPNPAFLPLFEIATTREGSEVVLIKEKPPGGPEATDPCFWWRRGRPRPRVPYHSNPSRVQGYSLP